MTYQVVNPATGEIGMMTGDSDANRMLCIEFAKKVAEQTGERWDVIQVNIIYTTEGKEDGSPDI